MFHRNVTSRRYFKIEYNRHRRNPGSFAKDPGWTKRCISLMRKCLPLNGHTHAFTFIRKPFLLVLRLSYFFFSWRLDQQQN